MAGTFDRKTRTAEPAGEMSSVETLSPSLSRTGASSVSGDRLAQRHRLDVGAAHDLAVPSGVDSPTVESAKRAWQLDRGLGAPSVRGSVITPVSAEAAADDRRAEIDRVVLHAAAAREIAVEGAQALGARGGHVADAGARAAGRLGHRGPRGDEVGEQPLASHGLEDPVAAREEHEGHRGMPRAGRASRGHRRHVVPRAVRARADHHLLDGRARDLFDGHHAIGRARQRDERRERGRSSSIWSS